MKRIYSKNPYELMGVKVVGKEKILQRAGKYARQSYWKLLITCETHPEAKKVSVYNSKLGTAGEAGVVEIMNVIEKSDYADKRYLFYCFKSDNMWVLADWKELSNK